MGYFNIDELAVFDPQLDRISKILTKLDSLAVERPYFSYSLRNIEMMLTEKKDVKASIALSCNLSQANEEGSIEVCFNGTHADIQIESDSERIKENLEAQEFIGCSSPQIADKVESVLEELPGGPVGLDYIFEIMGDRLRFDRKGYSFRGWTGGYYSGEPSIGVLKEIKDKADEWHSQEMIYNLEMRLDALYFLNQIINERLNDSIEDKGRKFVIGEAKPNSEKISPENQLQEMINRIDVRKYETLKNIKEYIKDKGGMGTSITITTSPSYSVDSKESYDIIYFGRLIEQPRISFTFAQKNRDMIYTECLISENKEEEAFIKSFEKSGLRTYTTIKHNDLNIIVVENGANVADSIQISAERSDIKDYSFEDFVDDYNSFQDFKNRLLNQQNI